MQQDVPFIKNLILKHLENDLTDKEKGELNDWLKDEKNRQLFEELTAEEKLVEKLAIYDHFARQSEKYYYQAQQLFKQGGQVTTAKARNIWLRYLVAASVSAMVFVAVYFIFFRDNKKELSSTQGQEERFRNDVQPGTYKAKLTLADGKSILLDTAAREQLVKQGDAVIINKDNQLFYNGKEVSQQELLYNVLSTNRGETYITTLSDGSKIWLNAASSIRYPVVFNNREREVEITGEAYLEVAKKTGKPFRVKVPGNTIIEVTGTTFNINAYADEPGIKTTLIEGAVNVQSATGKYLHLLPGQQVQTFASNNKEMLLSERVDILSAVAWKNRRFIFNKVPLQTIMREIARWYNVEVSYEDNVDINFVVDDIPRSATVTEILKILELTGEVKFIIEGKKITVIRG